MKAKEDNESRWKTKAGFDNVMKRENWNEHPKKPDPSTIENLTIPYHEQMKETKNKLKGGQFDPTEKGIPDFQAKVKAPHQTFAHPEHFKTVFISGEDMVR